MQTSSVQEMPMGSQKTFSFAEIVKGRDASVRVTDDGLLYAVDLVMVVTGASRDDAGKALRRLSDETFPSDKLSDKTFPGKGNYKTKLIGFQDAIELIMVLPGRVAKETRTRFADIIRRYLAGDQSLISEVRANAASDSPIAELARQARPEAEAEAAVELGKKRQLERDAILFELEVAERRQRLDNQMIEHQTKALAAQKALMETYTLLCPNQTMDDRARLMFKDNVLNLALLSSTASSNGIQPAALPAIESSVPLPVAVGDGPLTISTFAMELGKKHYDGKALQRIGLHMSQLYQQKYGCKAGQHEQLVAGAVRPVRSYTRRDQDLMREAFAMYDAEASSCCCANNNKAA